MVRQDLIVARSGLYNKQTMIRIFVGMNVLLFSVRAFTTPRTPIRHMRLSQKSIFDLYASSFSSLKATKGEKVDVTEVSAQEGEVLPINGEDKSKGRYDNLLQSVDLLGKLKHVSELPEVRAITPNDIFCNREVNMERIKCIGFGKTPLDCWFPCQICS